MSPATPVQAPRANAICERLLGTLRRECLGFPILLGEGHLRRILREWVAHYNRGWRHVNLGPGLPEPPRGLPALPTAGHRLPADARLRAQLILSGLHHEYYLEKVVA